MTYEYYITQPMQMIERVLNEKIYKNPQLIKTLRQMLFPLLTKYEHIYKTFYE